MRSAMDVGRLFVISGVTLVGGCAQSDTADAPWEADQVTVVRPGGDATVGTLPGGDACFTLPDASEDDCLQPQNQCEAGGAADVILDSAGDVLDVVCLPAKADAISPEQVADGELAQNENNTAIVVDGRFEGDLDVDANNVVVYGDDPDDGTLEGDLTIAGNNAIVRGVTIDGDVTVDKNGATFAYCRITGNLTIAGNNALISGCEVHGDIVLEGANNTTLSGNSIGGDIELGGGKNTECSGNRVWVDTDDDGRVDADELDDAVDC